MNRSSATSREADGEADAEQRERGRFRYCCRGNGPV